MARSVVAKLSERDRPQVFRAPPVPFVGSARGKAQSLGASALPFIGPALVVLCVINVVAVSMVDRRLVLPFPR